MYRNRCRPSCESVSDRKEVRETVGWWKGHDVDVNVREATVRDFESSNWRYNISLNFGSLTIYALPCPAGDVGSHVGPNEFGGDCLDGSLDAGMTEVVNRVEDSFPPCLGNEGTCRAVADVDDDVLLSDVDSFEVEA